MPDSELEQLKQSRPYKRSPDLRRLSAGSIADLLIGTAGAAIGLIWVMIHLVGFYHDQASGWNPSFLQDMMMYYPQLYLLGIIGVVLLIAGKRSQRKLRLLDSAAQAAHARALEIELRTQRDVQRLEWQQEHFRLLHLRFGWWKDGTEVVYGVAIEFSNFYGGPRFQRNVPMYRVNYEQSRDDIETVVFPERQGEQDLGAAVTLMLPHRPWWIKDGFGRFVPSRLTRLGP